MNENNHKKVVFRNAANGGVCATVNEKRAYSDKSWKPEPKVGEYWFVEVTGKNRDGTVFFLRGIERIEPRIIKQTEKPLDVIPPMGEDYCVVEVETQRNIKNTFGGGILGDGIDLASVAYCYGNEECTESLSYGRHGNQHSYYTIFCRPGTAAAERFLKQQARFAREEAERAENERREKERENIYRNFQSENSLLLNLIPNFNREMFDEMGGEKIIKMALEKYDAINIEFREMFNISIEEYLVSVDSLNKNDKYCVAANFQRKIEEGYAEMFFGKVKSYSEFNKMIRYHIMGADIDTNK